MPQLRPTKFATLRKELFLLIVLLVGQRYVSGNGKGSTWKVGGGKRGHQKAGEDRNGKLEIRNGKLEVRNGKMELGRGSWMGR
jgi:hypothetical protein